jgi:CRP/FNR family transcriptional regulator, cyclic AMP receptor protein
MNKAALIQLLGKLRFSANFSEDMLQRLASSAKVRRIPPHEVLFREKGESDQLMIICGGKVALDLNVPGHGSVRILTLGPGELLGWSALLGGRMTTTATALEEVTLVSISAGQVLATCEADHSFGYSLMRRVADSLAARLGDTRSQLIDLLTFEEAVGIQSGKQPVKRS